MNLDTVKLNELFKIHCKTKGKRQSNLFTQFLHYEYLKLTTFFFSRAPDT